MRVGVLTGGGDCPGLNAAIRALVRKGIYVYDYEFLGFRDGWKGVLEGLTLPLDISAVRGILPRGGTILGTTGMNPRIVDDGLDRVRATMTREGVDVLVAMGGEGTLSAAKALADAGVPIVAVPKTIDNDLAGTDYTFGFDTAVNVATEALDRLRTTAESHHRLFVVEVMGRNAGWIALHAGLAGGANVILIPEVPFDLDDVLGWVNARFEAGFAPIIVMSERAIPSDAALLDEHGATDEYGYRSIPNVGAWLGEQLSARTGREARVTVLGHLQRGGTPSAFDRWLATRFGLHAADAIAASRWGTMSALRGTEVVSVPIAEAVASLKTVPPERYAEAAVLFG